MNNKNLKLRKNKVSGFNFTNWNDTREILESTKNQKLTKQDHHVLGAIKLAYYVCESGKTDILKKSVSISAYVIAILFFGFVSIISLSNGGTTVQSVNAATVSASIKSFGIESSQGVGELIESTMSAITK